MGDLIKNNNLSALLKKFEADKMEEVLNAASESLGRPDGFTKKKSFAPSGVGYGSGTCPRYWYFAFNGANFVYKNTTRQRANMDNGTAAGERIAKLFEATGMLNGAEGKVIHDDPPIFGYIDLDVNWQGERMIGEVKTTTAEAFQTRAAAMKAPGYQMLQLLIYLYVTGVEKGFFYVENKNTHEVLVIPVKMTEERRKYVESVFDWMRTVKKAADEQTMPTRPFTPKSLQCKSCPVWDECWEGFVKKTAKQEGNDPKPGVIDLEPLNVLK